MKIKALLPLVASLLLMGACTHDQSGDPLPTEINLELTLPASGQLSLPASPIDQTIALKSGGADWRVYSTDKWLTATREGESIRLQAQSNTSQQPRRATVEVIAAGATRSFVVEQLAASADLSIGLTPDPLDQFGGERRVDVNTNLDTWLVSTEADWVHVDCDFVQRQIVIKVDENKDRQPREATIEVRQSEGDEPLTFVVSQQGIVYWILPILDTTLKPDQLEELEDRRHNLLQGVPASTIPERVFKFSTNSPAIVRLDYSYTRSGEAMYCKAILADASVVAEGEAYDDLKAFMQSQGFVEESPRFFRHASLRAEAQVVQARAEQFIYFCVYPVDTEDPDAKISRWPWDTAGPLSFVYPGASLTSINDYQTSIGGVRDDNYTTSRRVVYRHTEPGLEKSYVYSYNLNWSSRLSSLTYVDPNYRRILYFDGSRIFFKEPFRKMLQDNGYVFQSRDPYKTFSYTFRRSNPNVELLIEVVEHEFPLKGTEASGQAVAMTFKIYY